MTIDNYSRQHEESAPQEAAEPVKWMQSSGGYRFFKADGSEVNPAETPLYLSAPQEASKPECGICHGDPAACDIHDCGDAHSKEASKAVPVADERANFEKFVRSRIKDASYLERGEDGLYNASTIEHEWFVWQAACALSHQEGAKNGAR